MTKHICESLLQIALILPATFLFLEKYNTHNLKRILVFVLIFMGYQIVLYLPKHFEILKLVNGSWNWEGKILGILFGIVSYFFVRKLLAKHNFVTLTQDESNFRKASMVSIVVVILATIIWSVFGKSRFSIETLAFQLTLPGVDEELMYRGILLGLLLSGLKRTHRIIGNPALLIISVLFGLIHALKLDESFIPTFNLIYFMQTGLAGYAWGWVTIKSRSIVLAIFSHNFSNFFGTLAMMLK